MGVFSCDRWALSERRSESALGHFERVLFKHGVSPQVRHPAVERGESRPTSEPKEGSAKPCPELRAPTLAILTAVWEAAGYPWSVRLKAMLPTWMPPQGTASRAPTNPRGGCPSAVSSHREDSAPGSPLRGTRPGCQHKVEAKARCENDPGTPEPRLSSRSCGMSAGIFDPGLTRGSRT